jgi:alkanesulfonate monooxygenase SsuD/methylene tetrahydromethanopterin reductase-like flavin-dependent oxidoreductase (luciferase family)
MVGSMGKRMLAITLPHVDAWNAWGPWFGNNVDGYRELHATIDAACRDAGRDPTTLERTVALIVAMPGALGRGSSVSEESFEPIPGVADSLAPTLRAFADAGVAHVQLVLDPITLESIAALESVLAALDA